MRFENKVVLITGASTGIGWETAKLFAAEGAKVVINSITNRGAQATETLKAEGREAVFMQGDVANVGICRELIKKTVETYGRIDILINNAGIVPVGTAVDFDEAEFDRAFDINVKGGFFLSSFAIEQMRKQGGGVIVNTGSIAGLIGPKNRALYSATKGAVISMTRAMASDHASENIRVNCVCPGMVMSDSLRGRIAAAEDPEEQYKQFVKVIPIGKIGDAAEIAKVIALAASDETSFMTGSILSIDGGASL